MFIRLKESRGRKAWCVVVNRRLKDGRIKQRTLAYLGKDNSIDGAIASLHAKIEEEKDYRYRLSCRMIELQWKHHDYFKAQNWREPTKGERGPIRRLSNLQKRRDVASRRVDKIRKSIARLKKLKTKHVSEIDALGKGAE